MLSLSTSLLLVASALGPVQAEPESCAPPTIRSVEIVRHEVFDEEAGGLYRIVNKLHVVTREGVIARELLFEQGDPLDPEALDQSDRNLRVRAYLREVTVEVLGPDGVVLATAGTPELRALACAEHRPDQVDVRVTTRDSWSTSIEGRLKRAGDRTVWSIGLAESNFLGRGKEMELSHLADIDRTSNVVAYRDPRIAGGPLAGEVMYADQSDGARAFVWLSRPLLALDTPLAWRAQTESFDQIQPLYRRGDRFEQLRHVRRRHQFELSHLLARKGEVAYRVDGAYRTWFDEVGGDARDFGIFEVGLRRIEHRYRKLTHVNHERAEDLNLGAVSRVAVGASPGWLGAEDRAWFVSASHRQGAELGGDTFLVGSADWSARWEDGTLRDGLLTARLALLRYLGDRRIVYLSSELRDGVRLDPERQLLLGADRGLRGYPINQFTGDRAWVGSAELRWFLTDDLLRVMSLGVVGFFDVGATWRGPAEAGTDGLRRNVGVGLLIGRKSMSIRNAAVRIDLAYALDPVLGRGRWLLSFNPARLDF